MTMNEPIANIAANRTRLRKQAKGRGIEVPRGATAQEIENLISTKFREDHEAIRAFRDR
jgi:hypothetical protein